MDEVIVEKPGAAEKTLLGDELPKPCLNWRQEQQQIRQAQRDAAARELFGAIAPLAYSSTDSKGGAMGTGKGKSPVYTSKGKSTVYTSRGKSTIYNSRGRTKGRGLMFGMALSIEEHAMDMVK